MGLELVHDASADVVEIGIYNFSDIAACARKFADQLEDGKQGVPVRAVLVCQEEGSLAISVWGELSDCHQLMGIFEAAKLRVFADAMIDDD